VFICGEEFGFPMTRSPDDPSTGSRFPTLFSQIPEDEARTRRRTNQHKHSQPAFPKIILPVPNNAR